MADCLAARRSSGSSSCAISRAWKAPESARFGSPFSKNSCTKAWFRVAIRMLWSEDTEITWKASPEGPPVPLLYLRTAKASMSGDTSCEECWGFGTASSAFFFRKRRFHPWFWEPWPPADDPPCLSDSWPPSEEKGCAEPYDDCYFIAFPVPSSTCR